VAVCLYELSRDSNTARPAEKHKRSSAGEVERITTVLLQALHASGYVNARTEGSTEEKVRRLVRRLNLESGDAELWLGMLRQILWKIHSGGK
jgi:tRNA C32,U32 (ribose-2'-O)-methylase TrmJ